MHPTICQIGPFTIYSYGLMLVVAFLVGSSLAVRRARRKNINPDIIFNLCFLAFISGIIGARFFYVLQNIGYYTENPLEIFMLQKGGLVWFGGLIAGIGGAVFYLKFKKLSVYKILDLVVPYLALAQSIGRIGCLLNGCCFGKNSTWGIYFATHEATLIPTQIYSSLLLLVIFIILRLLEERPHKAGEIVSAYLILYSLKRFFIEFLRGDSNTIFLNLTLFQLISIVIFLSAFLNLIRIRKSLKN